MAKTLKTDQQVQDLTTQVKTLEDNWKRALADYQNLLRRVDHDKKEFIRLANSNLIARLLPSLDIIEMAASHTQDLGIQMAAKQFHEALTQEGLEVISPQIKDQFNHLIHECTESVSGEPQDTIAQLVLKGYKIGDYVLRPAKVKVFKVPEKIST